MTGQHTVGKTQMKFDLEGLKKAVAARIERYDESHNFTCDLCGREVFSNERVCNVCTRALPWNNGAVCPFCGRKTGEAGICLDCKESRIQVDKARSCCTHEGEAAHLVLKMKRTKYLYRAMAELAQPLAAAEFSDADAFTFIPMTKTAEKKRGYNQSRLFAGDLARRCGKECVTVAEKIRETDAQKFLGRKEREENLKGCFRITQKAAVAGKRILIVDDTLTTGATSGELAKALRKAGAEKVYLITFTSVQKKYPFGKDGLANG